MFVVATAGHVDHGKSTLVQALTGQNPDRLLEEQRRGLTIDLGFAKTQLANGEWVTFVDVPGHVDFVRTAIAGVAVVDAAILVVDAREGWRQQTYEHLFILLSAGISNLVVAVTKAGLASEVQRRAAFDETRKVLAKTAFLEAEVVACDSVSGIGLDAVRRALDNVFSMRVPPRNRSRPRVWIDRSFTIQGSGTVVTGGLTDGDLVVDDEVEVLSHVGLTRSRVRGLECLGVATENAPVGSRVAINLARFDHRTLGRGDALVRPDEWFYTNTTDAEITVVHALGHALTRRGAFMLHLGTAAIAVRLQILGSTLLEPGETGLLRLHLNRELPLIAGDHFVLTESGRHEVVGGGEILDIAPVLNMKQAQPDRSVSRVVREHGTILAEDLLKLVPVPVTTNLDPWVADPDWLVGTRNWILDQVLNSPQGVLDLQRLSAQERAVALQLEEQSKLEVLGNMARLPGTKSHHADHPLLAALGNDLFQPPTVSQSGLNRQDILTLQRDGLIRVLDGFVYSEAAVQTAIEHFRILVEKDGGGVTVAEFRDALATTRKWALPLLNYFDSVGISRRTGEVRTGGAYLTTRPRS